MFFTYHILLNSNIFVHGHLGMDVALTMKRKLLGRTKQDVDQVSIERKTLKTVLDINIRRSVPYPRISVQNISCIFSDNNFTKNNKCKL